MEFKLNDEQQLLRDMIREFTEKEVRPIAAEIDENERFPEELIPKMSEVGLSLNPRPGGVRWRRHGQSGICYGS